MAHERAGTRGEAPRQRLGEPDRAMLPAGAADRHGQVAALVPLERGQPARKEGLDLVGISAASGSAQR